MWRGRRWPIPLTYSVGSSQNGDNETTLILVNPVSQAQPNRTVSRDRGLGIGVSASGSRIGRQALAWSPIAGNYLVAVSEAAMSSPYLTIVVPSGAC